MISIDVPSTASNLKTLMDKNNITVRQLQGELGFNNPNSIYKWLRGEQLPSIDNLFIISSVLKCTIEDIVIINRWGGEINGK